jgi:UV DNA damage repair endonuclease
MAMLMANICLLEYCQANSEISISVCQQLRWEISLCAKHHYVSDSYEATVSKSLSGNFYRIRQDYDYVLMPRRNISTDSSEHIETCVNSWVEKGFINYFGLQRFGSRTAATQTVGK